MGRRSARKSGLLASIPSYLAGCQSLTSPSRIDDEALRTWIDALERRDVPRVQHLTWAEVTPTFVGLRELPRPS